MDIITFIQSIDWIFAVVLLLAGRYWGGKFFTITRNPARNFLAFATAFGFIWLAIKHFTVGITSQQAGGLFITYLFTTSFYELLAKQLFEKIEKWLGKKANKEDS